MIHLFTYHTCCHPGRILPTVPIDTQDSKPALSKHKNWQHLAQALQASCNTRNLVGSAGSQCLWKLACDKLPFISELLHASKQEKSHSLCSQCCVSAANEYASSRFQVFQPLMYWLRQVMLLAVCLLAQVIDFRAREAKRSRMPRLLRTFSSLKKERYAFCLLSCPPTCLLCCLVSCLVPCLSSSLRLHTSQTWDMHGEPCLFITLSCLCTAGVLTFLRMPTHL